MRLIIIVLWAIGIASMLSVWVLDTEEAKFVAYIITAMAWSIPAGIAAGRAFAEGDL